MHRLMVTSAIYCQGAANADSEKKDPANTWFARANIQRLTAEQVRDGLLAVAGELDLKQGGASVDANKSSRRSVYRKVMRNKPDEVMHAFDTPDHISHMPQRDVTTTATQSLLMMNSEWTRKRASAFAQRLDKLHRNNSAAQIHTAHQLTTGRMTTGSQLALGMAFLKTVIPPRAETKLQDTAPTNPPLALLSEYCHVLLNANAFLYID